MESTCKDGLVSGVISSSTISSSTGAISSSTGLVSGLSNQSIFKSLSKGSSTIPPSSSSTLMFLLVDPSSLRTTGYSTQVKKRHY